MLSKSKLTQLRKLESNIRAMLKSIPRTRMGVRRLADQYRAVLRLYQDALDGRLPRKYQPTEGERKKLASLAGDAILYLGGQGDRPSVSLKDYDHSKYGPYLGVSDEGSAAPAIREAALASPKMQAIGYAEPLVVGVAHDAERLGAVGEVPVGPNEYANVWLECAGRILTSTNIGTRLNLRHFKRPPVVTVQKGAAGEALRVAKQELKEAFRPFWDTPDGKPRPLTVHIEFDRQSRRTFKARVSLLRKLARFVATGKFADPNVHKLGFQMRIGYGARGCRAALLAIDLARAAGLEEVAIDGVVRKEADEKISFPGLLNYLTPDLVRPILRKAQAKGVRVRPKNPADPDTVARSVWSALNSAHHMGLELGKYGLFPLTLPEMDQVMGIVQRWFSSWTAAPAFYVDFPAVDSADVYSERNIVAGIKKWLQIVSKHRIPVVLMDTADKDKGRKLLKNSPTDRVGILLLEQIADINDFAKDCGIKILWAGGITAQQAFDMGKLSPFGIYVTSATAVARPVTGEYRRDAMLSREKEPTFEGVYRVKLLLESGFLINRLREYGLNDNADAIDLKAKMFLKAVRANSDKERIQTERNELVSLTLKAWKTHFRCCSSKGKRQVSL